MVTANVRLTRPLGEGAMGCVWVAEHLTLETEVAVKFISAHHAQDAMVLRRFVQEAKAAAKIKSPHVVQTFDHGVMGDGTPYIVMELLEGESLQERLDRGGWLSLEETARVITQVARALSKAHELGIVHRDIKPDNIFMTPTEDGVFCKLLDFGIAKQTQVPQMGALTNAGIMVGTPEYMSPEQVLSAKDVDFHADLWGLTVTTYYMLTADLPFTAEALGTLCVKLLDGRFTPVTELRTDLPQELDGWFERAMAPEVADRFDSARAMVVRFIEIVSRSPDWSDASEPLSYKHIATPAPVDVTARMAAPAGTNAGLDTTAPLPQPTKAKSETLTGSSSTRRRDDKRWVGAAVVGAVGVVAAVGIVALLASDVNDANQAPAAPIAAEEPIVDVVEEDVVEEATPAAASASASAVPERPSPTTAGPTSPPLAPEKETDVAPVQKTKRWDHGF
jgi:serine/threonine protein kinase